MLKPKPERVRQGPPDDRQLLVRVPRSQRRRQEKVFKVPHRRGSGPDPRPEVNRDRHPEGQRRQLFAGGPHLVHSCSKLFHKFEGSSLAG